jgi:hypothetical protein
LYDFNVVELRRWRFRGFATRSCVLPSLMVSDQKALVGGRSPFGKWSS